MQTIGVIAEGVTDQQVLDRLLQALCEKPAVNTLQPADAREPGNWDKVFKYVGSERFRNAFQNNDFIVIQIDTDVCEEFNPPVLRTVDGMAVPEDTIIAQVKQLLIAKIDENAPGYYQAHKERIIFAITLNSTECWLLLLFSDRESDRKRRDNCLNLLNQRVSPLGFSIDPNNKSKGYASLLRNDKVRKLKRDKAVEISQYNPGFADFVGQVETLVNAAP